MCFKGPVYSAKKKPSTVIEKNKTTYIPDPAFLEQKNFFPGFQAPHNKKEKLLFEIPELNNYKPASIEHMRLLIEAERQYRLPDFFCYVLDITKLNDFNSFLINCKSITVPIRFQLIVKILSHYAAVDILWSKSQKQCLLMDAANDLKMFQLFLKLKDFGFDQLFIPSARRKKDGKPNNLQKDGYSCNLFSLDHAIQSSRLPIFDILNNIQNKSNQGDYISIFWDDLPYPLIWNAQSYSFLDAYLEKNNEKMTEQEKLGFQAYLKQHCIIGSKGKKINNAARYLFERKTESAVQLINSLEEDEIEAMVSSSFLDKFSELIRE